MQTSNGRPIVIDREWFRARYGQNFPDLLPTETDTFLDTCIKDVYTLFGGVQDLWDYLDRDVYESKTQMCYGLLVAWYIVDLFPDRAIGIMSMGGLPVKSKKIGNTTIQFGELSNTSTGASNNADLLSTLKSNAFGVKAYTMIKSSGKLNFFIRH